MLLYQKKDHGGVVLTSTARLTQDVMERAYFLKGNIIWSPFYAEILDNDLLLSLLW
jgi:hypothetical protein